MRIRVKLYLIAGGLSALILMMFAVTWYTTNAQKTDGLLINLARELHTMVGRFKIQ